MRAFKVVILTSCLCALAIGLAGAQDRPSQFIEVITMEIRAGMVPQFEEYMKKIVEAADKVGVRQHWATYQTALGGAGRAYSVVLGFEKWEEMDAWTAVAEGLNQTFGEKEADQIYKMGSATIEKSETRVYRLSEEMSTKLKGIRTRYAMVTETKVKREMLPDFRMLADKIKAAEESDPESRLASRWECQLGPTPMFLTVRPFDKFAESDDWPSQSKAMREMYSERELARLQDIYREAVESMDIYVIELREGLSRLRALPTTDN
jgi:hypothetical protein